MIPSKLLSVAVAALVAAALASCAGPGPAPQPQAAPTSPGPAAVSATAIAVSPTPVATGVPPRTPTSPAATGTPTARPGAPAPTATPTGTPRPSAVQRTPPGSGEAIISVTGVVGDVATSARVITFAEQVHGINGVALTDDTEIVAADGRPGDLRDIQPGMVVQASGGPGGSGMVLATRVRIVSGPTTPRGG